MVVFGEADRPRIVVQGFGQDHPFAAVVERYAGTVHFYDDTAAGGLRWDSWDAVVAVGEPAIYADHLRVLQIGGDPAGRRGPGGFTSAALTLVLHPGDELVIPDSLPADIQELVRRELLPLVTQDGNVYRTRISPMGFQANAPDSFVPLLHDLDHYALAALYNPPRGGRHCLYLPGVVTDLAPWLLLAFSLWSAESPEVFPSEPEWTSRSEWMTDGELRAKAEVDNKRAEAERIISEAEASIAAAETTLRELRVLRVIHGDDVGVIGGDDDGSMRTAPLGVVSGAVVDTVTGSSA